MVELTFDRLRDLSRLQDSCLLKGVFTRLRLCRILALCAAGRVFPCVLYYLEESEQQVRSNAIRLGSFGEMQ